jgi:hypothetical protein
MRPALFAFAVASAFLGAALYINLVEQPARLALHVRSMIREWISSNRRGFIMLATSCLLRSRSSLQFWPTRAMVVMLIYACYSAGRSYLRAGLTPISS